MVLLPPSSKCYKTKDRGYCYSKTRPEGGGGAGVVSGRVWWCFKRVLVIRDRDRVGCMH
jgi:hypothetical protein